MSHPVVPADAQPCLWVSAGLLTYRLCDRDFDCERCPLDAALRGAPHAGSRREALLAPGRDAEVFPIDRRYTTGHTWLQAIGDGEGRVHRFGLDSFAAAMIGRCVEIRCDASPRVVARGETICRIDLGLGQLSVGAPFACEVPGANLGLADDPGRLVTAPYGNGWLAELKLSESAHTDGLLTAEAAQTRARLDLQRFRRRVAIQMLADANGVGRSLADGGELVADLRQMLGGPAYLDLLRELIH